MIGKSVGFLFLLGFSSVTFYFTSVIHPSSLSNDKLSLSFDARTSGKLKIIEYAAGGLSREPVGTHIDSLFVKPSTRKKELGIDVDLSDVRGNGSATVDIRLLDEKDALEKSFNSEINLVASAQQTVHLSFPWENPRLWDFNQPNLYKLILHIRGNGIDTEYTQSFGFREFWIEGRRFFLNGIPIRLRPNTGQNIDEQKASGFNFTFYSPEESAGSVDNSLDEAWYDKADKAGWLTTGKLASLSPYLFAPDNRLIWDAGQKAKWLVKVEREIRELRNHPSVLMWTHSPGIFGNEQDQNPRYIGRTDPKRRTVPTQAYSAGQDGCALIRQIDPTRPVFTPGGGDVGDVYTVFHFLNLIPLEEREQWMNDWAKHGDMPYMGIEFGAPYFNTFLRGRGERATQSEPLLTEYASIYLGSKAYQDETAPYRDNYAARFNVDQKYRFDGRTDTAPIVNSPDFQNLESLFNTNTWRTWRTMGVSGGMITRGAPGQTGNEKLDSDRALMAVNAPTLAWIAGLPEDFTSKSHAYHTDETVEKQAVLINDTRQEQPFALTWQALVEGRVVLSGHEKGTIKPAQTLYSQIKFPTPFIRASKTEGEIRLSANIGTDTHADKFPFRIYARPYKREGNLPTLPVFDPGEKTGDLLLLLDFASRPWKGEMNVPLVIIGRNALSSGRRVPGDLEAYVRRGGKVLMFSQDPQWVTENLGFRVSAHLSRRAFPTGAPHGLTKGLDAEDLRDWRGNSLLVPASPMVEGPMPPHGWHWGNQGAVATLSVEKPHMSGWRPILENEFDLAYSPLMELDYGKGRVIWCMLDLEDHASNDAAALRVTEKVVNYARMVQPPPKANQTFYVGGDDGNAILKDFQVIHVNTGKTRADLKWLQVVPGSSLLIVGADATLDRAGVVAFLAHGGRIFYMSRSPTAGSSLGIVMKTDRIHGSLDVPAWPELRGLSLSDLHWRGDVNTPLIQQLPDLTINGHLAKRNLGADGLLGRLQIGKGVALFCQIDPIRFDADNKTYFRLTRWRQTRAFCQLLANMGASFTQDSRIFHPSRNPALVPDYYYPDYRTDFVLGDDPYRYYRW